MNSKVYKYCVVPQCKNTTIKTPNKVFIHVPNKKIIRDKWLKLAQRNPNDLVTNSAIYLCEDHFDLPNDMENYMEYHVMGSVSQVRMKPGCVPKKFICQSGRKTQISDKPERPYIAKKRRMMILEECEKQIEEKNKDAEQSSSKEIASHSGLRDKKVYKWCVVPQCTNTSIKSPQKLFISVPTDPKRRNMWLRLARRNPISILAKSNVFMCEDHFDVEKDIINYMKYKMGFSEKLLLAVGAVPTKFHCQEECKRRLPGSSRKVLLERQSESTMDMPVERLQKDDNIIPEINEPRADTEAVAEDGEAEMEDEVGKVCRACLATGVRMVDVAAGGLQDTFEHVTGTELHTRDERPRQVCYVCCSQLQRFRAFCQMSRKADTYMTKLVQRGLQITEQAVTNRHRLIKPKLDVTQNPLIAIHTQEDPDECVPVEVKVEVENEGKNNNRRDSETESETEIERKAKTTVSDREPDRENETEERQPDWEPEGEIKIEIDEVDIEEFDPFEAVEHTTVSDETCYCIQCAEAFPSQSDLLKHMQNHTQQKLKPGNASRQNVKAKVTKRNVKSKLASQCKFCNKTFAIQAQLVAHVVTEHGLGEFSLTQKPKRRKPNILKKRQ